jgi:hypothetical protein
MNYLIGNGAQKSQSKPAQNRHLRPDKRTDIHHILIIGSGPIGIG